MSPLHRSVRCFTALALLVSGFVIAVSSPEGVVHAVSDLTLTVGTPSEQLADDPSLIPMSFTATNPASVPATNGYNGSFIVELPAGLSFVSGALPPSSIATLTGGRQAMFFENVGDIQEGSTLALDFVVAAPRATFPVGASIATTARFGTSTDPRQIPDFNAANGTFGGDTDGQVSASSNTKLTPIEIVKSSTVGAEDEILRGVHDQQQVYTLTITNNGQDVTNTVVVEDFVPAVFEFLGCGDVDNTTTGVVEYPGAGRLDVDQGRSAPDPATDCPTPALVEMVIVTSGVITNSASGLTAGDAAPDPTIADGVYTHVVWNVGNMAIDGVATINYKIGVPLRANAYEPDFYAPDPDPGVTTPVPTDPTANLDNNTGGFTTEKNGAELGARNYAGVVGVFQGTHAPGFVPATDTRDAHDIGASIEDLSIHKSVTVPDPVVQGINAVYSFQIEVSEYRTITNAVITDDGLSNGQCPLPGGAGDAETLGGFTGGDVTAECAGGPAPTFPFTSLAEQADGTWTITWDQTTAPFLSTMLPNSVHTMEFSAVVRDHYQIDGFDDAPTNGVDSFTNDVDIAGATNLVVLTPDDPLTPGDETVLLPDDPTVPNGTSIQDDSGASFGAASANLDKSISVPVAAGVELDCDTAAYVQTDPSGTPSTVVDPPYAYRIGDRVCFRLGADFRTNLNYRNARVDDFLPAGMAFEKFWGTLPAPPTATGQTSNNDVVIASVVQDTTPDQNAIQWYLGAKDPAAAGGPYENDLFVDNTGQRFEVVFSAVVTRAPADRTTADLVQNLQKLTAANIDGATISVRDSADFDIVQPVLSTSKAADTAVAIQGQSIGYVSSVSNDSASPPAAPAFAADFAAAIDVSSWDVLPAGIACIDVSNLVLSAAGTIIGCTDGAGPDGRSVIEFVIDRIDPQQTVDLTYDVTLPIGIAAGQTLVNDLGVRQYRGTTSNDANAANDPTFIPSNNIDPTLNPSANMGDARSTATVTTPMPVLQKEQQSSFGDSSNDRNGALAQTIDELTIGELVQYRVRDVTIPEGTSIFNAVLSDTLPAGLVFVQFDSASLDDGNGTVTDLLAAPGAFTLTQVGRDITLTFPTTYDNPPATGTDAIEVVLTAIVADLPGTTAGDALDNSATLDFDNAATGGQSFSVSTNTVTSNVIEPRLEVDIDAMLYDGTAGGAVITNPTCDDTPGNDTTASDDPDGTLADGCNVQPGDVLWQKGTVTNVGNGNAYETTVISVVPVHMTPLVGVGSAKAIDGDTILGPSGSTGVWDAGARTITWSPLSIVEPGAGNAVSVDFVAVLDDSVLLSDDEDFTTTIAVPSYFGLPAAQRNADTPTYGAPGPSNPNGRGAVDPDRDTVEIHFPDITVDKVAIDDFTDARLGQPFAFEIRVTNGDETATAYDVDVTDMLPTGWTYTAGAPAPDSSTASPLAWTGVFDVPPGQTRTIAYTATPDAVALATIAGTGYDGGTGPEAVPYTNSVDVLAEDGTNATASADGDFDAADDQTVYIRRTDIEVVKTISPIDSDADPNNGPYFFGSFVNYTITVTNKGPDASTNVVVDDLLTNPPLLFDAVVSADAGTYDPVTGVWAVGPMADGATLDLVLRVRLTGLGSVTNGAEQTANDQFDIDSTPGNDVLTEDDQDQVVVTVVPTSLGDFVYLDLNGDGVQDPGEPGIPGVNVRITFPDPANPLITRTYTAITDVNGAYSLPPTFVDETTSTTVGTPVLTDITVRVLTASSPNLTGLVATDGTESDVDGGADGVSVQQIIPGDASTMELPDGTNARLDVDFGFQPQGQRLGDRVWWDQDRSADATDSDPATATEFGLPDVTLTATWGGFDGIVGDDTGTVGVDEGADDLVFTTVTSDGTSTPRGSYLFDGVPPGNYEVAVVTATLPSSLNVPTYDLDGTISPHVVSGIVLTPAVPRVDVDFSYVGPGELGDRVWFDFDGNGVQDVGEPGISAVDVEVQWYGPDGVPDNADDVVTIVTTSDGTTDVDRDLVIDPAGSYYLDGLPTGTYDVTVVPATLPGSMVQTYDDDQTGAGLGNTSSTTLSPIAPSDRDQDFGYRGDLSLGDLVWFDVAADGNAAPDVGDGDLPLAGVPVTVTWAGSDGIFGTPDDFTTTVATSDGTQDTDGDLAPEALGVYLVSNLADGLYRVDVSTTGVLSTLGLTTQTYDDDQVGAGLGNTSTTTLAGSDDLDQDFSYTGVGRIGDTVWFDFDEDGGVDVTEPGFENVVVQLTWGGQDGVLGDDPVTLLIDESADDQVYTTVTDDQGVYDFADLPFGNYEVVVDPNGTTLPAGLEQVSDPDSISDGRSRVLLDATGAIRLDQDFGYNGVGSVGDTVWLDLDGDRTRDAADPAIGFPAEPGLPNVDVEVRWNGADGINGTVDDFVITVPTSDGTQDVDGNGSIDPVGYYRVPDLPFGTVVITVDPAGLILDLAQTHDASGALDHRSIVTLAADDAGTPADESNAVDQDFGYIGRASLGDLVFYDIDGNGSGVIDGADVPIPNVVVEVTWGGPDGMLGDNPGTATDESADDLVFTVPTDGNGLWNLSGLPPGQYQAAIDAATLPAGIDIPTFDRDGTADGDTLLTLGATDDVDDVDFSFTGLASLGDTIFVDLDGDGDLDPDEVGIGGVTVTATYTGPDGSTVSLAVVTSDGTRDVDGDSIADQIGSYFVENLPFDVPITVMVDAGTLPAGLSPSSDPDGTLDDTSEVTLTPADAQDLDQDFGYRGIGALGDVVFYDADGAGGNIPDPLVGDVGLPNVGVTAVWGGRDGVIGDDPLTIGDESLDDMTMRTTTNTVGVYRFDHLPEGTFAVNLDPATLPAGVTPVFDPDLGGDYTSLVTLDTAGGVVNLDQDFSLTGTGRVGDTIWEDTDADGVLDAGERPVGGVRVILELVEPITGALTTLTTTTRPDGTYAFSNLPAGTYTIRYDRATLPTGFAPASDPDAGAAPDGAASFVLGSGGTNLDLDFGVRPLSTVTGVIFEDTDGDGIRDPGEPGISGVSVDVTDANGDTVRVVTDADGRYAAADVLAGTLTIDVVDATVPSGVALSTGNEPHTVTAPAGTSTPAEPVGFAPPTFVNGTVWYDVDAAGDADADEPGLSGVVVDLLDADGVVVATTTTNAAGFYEFSGVPTGVYSVRIDTSTLPPGLDRQTFDVDGTLDGSHPFTLPPAGLVRNDFGYTGTGAVTETVWIDLDRDGTPGAGDRTVAGVVITLTWSGPDGVLGTADDVVHTSVSDGSGTLRFGDLPAGRYRISIDPGTLPSGARPVGATSATFTLLPGETLTLDDFPLETAAIPHTGSEVGRWLRLSLTLLGVGAGMLVATRRRRDAHSS